MNSWQILRVSLAELTPPSLVGSLRCEGNSCVFWRFLDGMAHQSCTPNQGYQTYLTNVGWECQADSVLNMLYRESPQDDQKEGLLGYDDTAFYYFFSSAQHSDSPEEGLNSHDLRIMAAEFFQIEQEHPRVKDMIFLHNIYIQYTYINKQINK